VLKVGLTGGIACGKTVVRQLLDGLGAFTLDADGIVHRLMRSGTELTRSIAQQFGDDMLASDGSVDRRRLGALVFSNPDLRRQLNELVHSRVIDEEHRLLGDAQRRGERVAVVDAALMVEAGTYRNYDVLVVVDCPRSLQIERIVERDQLSETQAAERVDAQLPAEERKRHAHFVIDTSGTLEETERQVKEIWKKLVVLAEKKTANERK
jgi:dephospho-CoA kinase